MIQLKRFWLNFKFIKTKNIEDRKNTKIQKYKKKTIFHNIKVKIHDFILKIFMLITLEIKLL